MQIANSSANSKYVSLHFNINNDILKLAFKLLDLKYSTKARTKVTASYKEFKNDNLRKYIFVKTSVLSEGLSTSW